ncbi:hypothetical protein MLD38_017407 [Melastoma candidum]|uniref:Uncharacterized protein n=1 Tax=Melastoma candidum TaxID=119954 RepID=A0ACB9QRN8_9MYRT|nr:hypothetical protein MLD38_017407 [Melastoma candidum]
MSESRHRHLHVNVAEKSGPDDSDGHGGRRKRRRMSSKGKLMIGQRVEVRKQPLAVLLYPAIDWIVNYVFSRGSWHPGRVISFDHRKRGVEYDHILTEDGLQKLVNFVPISAAADGFISDDFYDSDSCKRGFLRPLPPIFVFGPLDLHYGLCVDVFYNEDKSLWEKLVTEVVIDNLSIVAAAVLPFLNSSEDSENDHSKNELPIPEKDVAVHLAPSQGDLDLVMKKPEAISGSAINCGIGTVQSPFREAFTSEPGPFNDLSVAANVERKMVDVSNNCCIPVDCGYSAKPLQVENAHDLGSEEHSLSDVFGISTNLLDGTGNSFAFEAAKRLEENSSLTKSLSNMRQLRNHTQ